jgi:hypothetical protein
MEDDSEEVSGAGTRALSTLPFYFHSAQSAWHTPFTQAEDATPGIRVTRGGSKKPKPERLVPLELITEAIVLRAIPELPARLVAHTLEVSRASVNYLSPLHKKRIVAEYNRTFPHAAVPTGPSSAAPSVPKQRVAKEQPPLANLLRLPAGDPLGPPVNTAEAVAAYAAAVEAVDADPKAVVPFLQQWLPPRAPGPCPVGERGAIYGKHWVQEIKSDVKGVPSRYEMTPWRDTPAPMVSSGQRPRVRSTCQSAHAAPTDPPLLICVAASFHICRSSTSTPTSSIWAAPSAARSP